MYMHACMHVFDLYKLWHTRKRVSVTGGVVIAQEDAFAQCLGATGQITLQFRIGATLYPPTLSLSLSHTRANIFLFVNLSAYYMFFFFCQISTTNFKIEEMILFKKDLVK